MKARVLLGVLAVVGASACGQPPAATAEFFGPTIEPPRGLAKLHPGMSVADARQLVPELREPSKPGVRDELTLESGARDVALEVRVDAGTVSSILAVVQGHGARETLTRAWGEPQITRDSLGQPEVTWASEASGWKVKLDCLERNCLVEYVPYHVLTAEFFGAHVVPPGELAKLRIGMPIAEARAVAPAPIAVRAGITTGVDAVREFVAIDDKLGTVRAIYLNLPPHAEDLIAQAWGPATPATEPVGKRVQVWLDPTTGWRATLRDALGYSHDLAFDNYLPAAALFGDQPDRLDGLPEPVLGRALDDVKKDYKDSITIAGKDVYITLLPTEWDRFGTRIALGIAAGHVRDVSFEIPFKAHPEAHDALYELFKKKWGLPTEGGQDDKPVLVFRDEAPRVEVVDDAEHGAWRIEIH